MRALIARVLRRAADCLAPSPRRRRPRWPAAPELSPKKLPSASAQISRLSNVFGVTCDAELARALGVAKTTISSWRARGIPCDRLIDVAQQRGVSIGWIVFGDSK